MVHYPVHFDVQPSPRFSRVQLGLRVVVLLALGAAGLSLGLLFALVFFLLPVVAAVRVAAHQDAESYVRDDGPRILFALRWLAAATAWLGLATEQFPRERPEETVTLELETVALPTMGGAAARVLLGLPSAIVLAVLSWIGGFVWLWAALNILIEETIGARVGAYLLGIQRWTYRLLVYQAALVDEYPPFGFEEGIPRQQGPQSPLSTFKNSAP